jgi:hypothetical protein
LRVAVEVAVLTAVAAVAVDYFLQVLTRYFLEMFLL